jgi:hypothetical protein
MSSTTGNARAAAVPAGPWREVTRTMFESMTVSILISHWQHRAYLPDFRAKS